MVRMNEDKSVLESVRVPVRGKYDIVVAGGGLAGVTAALTAARSGASVALVEPNTFLGGGILAGSGVWDDCPGGFGGASLAGELLGRLTARGAVPGLYEGHTHGDREWLPQTLLDMVAETEGIRLILHSFVASLLCGDGVVLGVTMVGKYGTEALLAGEVIDATGNALLAEQAGLRPLEQKPAVARAAIGLGKVDLARALLYARAEGSLVEAYHENAEEEGRILRLAFTSPFRGGEATQVLRMTSNLPGRVTQLSGVEVPLADSTAKARGDACAALSAAGTRLAALLQERVPGFEESFIDWSTSAPLFDYGRRYGGEATVAGYTAAGRSAGISGEEAGAAAAGRVKGRGRA